MYFKLTGLAKVSLNEKDNYDKQYQEYLKSKYPKLPKSFKCKSCEFKEDCVLLKE
jgi:CRISPR/Cas system-associated exonuclease Cas4 (RecB family)